MAHKIEAREQRDRGARNGDDNKDVDAAPAAPLAVGSRRADGVLFWARLPAAGHSRAVHKPGDGAALLVRADARVGALKVDRERIYRVCLKLTKKVP